MSANSGSIGKKLHWGVVFGLVVFLMGCSRPPPPPPGWTGKASTPSGAWIQMSPLPATATAPGAFSGSIRYGLPPTPFNSPNARWLFARIDATVIGGAVTSVGHVSGFNLNWTNDGSVTWRGSWGTPSPTTGPFTNTSTATVDSPGTVTVTAQITVT